MTTMVRPPSQRSAYAREIAAARVAASNLASERFFSMNAESIADACRAMAARFQLGGRLLVRGGAAQQSDVAHAVVEFLHPVIVGKRSLPAMALPNVDSADAAAALRTLGRPDDVLLVVGGVGSSAADEVVLAAARDAGTLTVLATGNGARFAPVPPDFHFRVPSSDACVVQETHEMLYHVLWELVHVFLDSGPVKS